MNLIPMAEDFALRYYISIGFPEGLDPAKMYVMRPDRRCSCENLREEFRMFVEESSGEYLPIPGCFIVVETKTFFGPYTTLHCTPEQMRRHMGLTEDME